MKASQYSETCFDAVRKIWSGKKLSPLFNEDMSLGQVSLFVLGINPHKVIQISDTTNEQLTCQDLAQLGVRAAQNLKLKLGIQQGDVIGIAGRNTTYLAPVILGALLIGAPISPFHHTSDKNTVKHVYGLTKPKLVLCDEDAYHTISEGLEEVGLSCLIYILKGHIDGVPNVQDLLQDIELKSESDYTSVNFQKGSDRIAGILCSSGTTGLPKGVCISHQNLLCRLDFSFIETDDVLFTFSTLHWISGLWFLVRSFITGALRIITEEPFTPELCIRIIKKYKVTAMIGPPSYASEIIQTPNISDGQLSSLRNYICGGSAVSVTVTKKLQGLLGNNAFIEAYGLTELGGLSNLNQWPFKKEGSVGRLSPNTEARILTEDGEPLGVNEKGEIYIRSKYNWKGYYANMDMTRTAIDSDGWIKTGDLGHFDEDGFLFICGRQKEILKYNNFQISPVEIEEQIMRLPGVIEVCVFGIPDPIACDLPAAAIVKSSDCSLTEEDVSKKVSSCFSEAKHLHGGVYFLKELPKTPSGKIQRNQLLSIIRKSIEKRT